jgi:hypothetical protein
VPEKSGELDPLPCGVHHHSNPLLSAETPLPRRAFSAVVVGVFGLIAVGIAVLAGVSRKDRQQ